MTVRKIDGTDELIMFKYFIEKIHYLHNLPSNVNIRLGIFVNDVMIGAVGYGTVKTRSTLNKELGLNYDEIVELKRLVIADKNDVSDKEWYKNAQRVAESVKFPESRAISLGNEEVKRMYPVTKIINTYSDPQFHEGIVYKATNAIDFGGEKGAKNLYIYIVASDKREERDTRLRMTIFGTRKPVTPLLAKEPFPDQIERIKTAYKGIKPSNRQIQLAKQSKELEKRNRAALQQGELFP
jgi:hypothetical protein